MRDLADAFVILLSNPNPYSALNKKAAKMIFDDEENHTHEYFKTALLTFQGRKWLEWQNITFKLFRQYHVLRGMFEGLSATLAMRDNLYMDSDRDYWSTIYIKKSQPHIFKAFPSSSSSTMLSCTSWCFYHLISMSKESFFWNYRIIFYPSCLNISYILSLSM